MKKPLLRRLGTWMMYSTTRAGSGAHPPSVYLEQSGQVIKLEYAGEPLVTLLAALDRIKDGAHPA
ncbi:hypothetical protein ABZ726_02905 [Streptomyces hundungensis]|uniref:hypothetical protein n=1 Tax=Streptomyces hundungensis TaxID=1077946 RepID=UPI0034027AE7